MDNASSDGSLDMLATVFPHVKIICNTTNLGYARANNQGMHTASGDYVLLLNSDTIISPQAVAQLLVFMQQHPPVGAVSPRLLRPDGTPQPYAFGCDPTPGYLFRRGLTQIVLHRPLHDWGTAQLQAVDWVSGACLLVRRAAIEQVGLLDENMFMYFEDNDWCLRIRKAGWKVYYHPQIEIVHIGGQSLKKNPRAQRAYYESLTYFYHKHYGPLTRLSLRLMLPIYKRIHR